MRNRNFRTVLTALLAASILALIPASATLASDTYTPKYSDDELYKVYEELLDKYMNDASDAANSFIVTAIGVGGAVIDGQTTGFGESGLEKRGVVTVRYQYYEEYKKLLEEQYGDIVYVEYSESSKADYESQSINFDDGTGTAATDPAATDPARISETDSTHGTGTSAKTQIIVGVILAIAAAAAIYFYVKKNRKPAKKGKKK